MSIAKNAIGSLFQIGDGASPEVFTTIPEVIRIQAPNVRFDLHDVTSHDSTGGFREFLPGLADGENATAELNWVPSNTVHKSIRVDAYAKTLRNFKIVFADDTVGADNTIVFQAYIVNWPPVANAGEPFKATMTAKVTGQPTWSNTP
jgi:predicted secreted protein